jgi:hypothetical protein
MKGDNMTITSDKTVMQVFKEDVKFLEKQKLHPRQPLAEVLHRYVTSFMPGTVLPSTTAVGYTSYSLIA